MLVPQKKFCQSRLVSQAKSPPTNSQIKAYLLDNIFCQHLEKIHTYVICVMLP